MKRVTWLIALMLVLVGMTRPNLVEAQKGDPPIPEEPGVAGDAVAPLAVNALITPAFAGSPAYDSGWTPLGPGRSLTFRHGLGGNLDDYVVILDFKSRTGNGIHQRYYGGMDFGTKSLGGGYNNRRMGAYWRSLTTSTIVVYRRLEDTYADWVRVRIWLDPNPDYDSGWLTLSPGAAATTLQHNLGGNPDDYVVDMQYRSANSGVNQRYFGGADFGTWAFNGTRANHRVGAYWRSLTKTSITLFRRAEDDYASQVRIRIWRRPRPTYDSGWIGLAQDQIALLFHYIGGDPNNYVVDMQYRSANSGVNRRYFGGMDVGSHPPPGLNENDRVGAYWRRLNAFSITVYRRPEDVYASQVRVRIWHYWRPVAPDYDSRWVSISPGQARTLTHNLGGAVDRYLVDMQYRNVNSGVNQRYFGGADFGTKAFNGTRANHRVGVYWRTLTNASITLFRRAEDDYADRTRIRIWRMPRPDYDSGWVSINQNQAKTFYHNLRGNVNDYLVDLQYRNAANGVNQRYYGGMDVGSHPPPGLNENDRVGAYWRSLNASYITVYRRPDDVYAPQVRVRIWRLARPDYMTTWIALNPDQTLTLQHRLYSHPDNYLLRMWQYDMTFNYINQRHYGGADFGTHPPAGYASDQRVGAYWRSLTETSVTLYRRPEDGFADGVMVRIWDYSRRQYLPSYQKNAP